jgi:hypothetical protein
MRTIFICSERKINNYVGEYYDEVIEVPHQPTVEGIEAIAKSVHKGICKLWEEDKADLERTEEPCVEAYLDAASPFNSMLIDYQVVMKDAGIKLELPYLKSTERVTNDREANELIKKLESRG